MLHELKADPDLFARLADGSKTFEIRLNDRGFQAGDELVIRAYDRVRSDDCGKDNCGVNYRRPAAPVLRFRVGFVAAGTLYGLELGGYVVMSLLPIGLEPADA